MLWNNYRQVLDIVKHESVAFTEADLERWEAEEVGQESEWDVHAVAYVELLQELRLTQ
jgi:hypothetical protein